MPGRPDVRPDAPVRGAAPPPRRWWMLGVLAAILVLSMTTWFSATAVIPQLRAAWRLSDTAAAWMTIAVQVGFVAGAVGSSVVNLSDLLPAGRLIVLGAVGAAAANAGILALGEPADPGAGGPGVALALRLLTGMFLAGVYPPALKLIATWFVRGRGLALGVLVGALTLGSAAPHLVNALGGLRWQVVIAGTSLTTLAGAGLAAALAREGPYPFPRASFDPGQVARVFRNRGVLLASLGYFGHMWELYAMWAWFLTFAREALSHQGIAAAVAAPLLAFAVIGAGALGCVGAGLAADRWGRAEIAGTAMALSGLCALASGLVWNGPTWAFVALGLVWGVAVVADSAQFSALVTEHGDPRYVGTALTLQLGLGFLLTVATIWLLPFVARAAGSWQWTFLVLVPGPALGLCAMIALRRSGRVTA